MARRYFGTDGVRGVVGDTLTEDLVRRLGGAAAMWSGSGNVLVGRDTRASGRTLESVFGDGVISAGSVPVLAGVLPTPAVALLAALQPNIVLGAVISASHNPPEYNGVKLFTGEGHKLTDAQEEEIEALLEVPRAGSARVDHASDAVLVYADLIVDRFGTDLSGLKIAVDCSNGAFSHLAPGVLLRLGAEVTAIGCDPDGTNINVGCGATDLALLQATVRDGDYTLGIAFDGDGDRLLAVDETGAVVDGDQIVALIALSRKVEVVAVTVMTNLGFHRLMGDHGIRVVTTDVGDRYVLDALRREGGVLGGEQSGHVILLDGHVTGDGLAIALALCRALDGRQLSEAAAIMPRFAQVTANVPVSRRELPQSIRAETERLNAELDGAARVLVRPSGTEPVVRVLAEAVSEQEARRLSARLVELVRRELG